MLPSRAIRIIVNMSFLIGNWTWTASQVVFTIGKFGNNFDTSFQVGWDIYFKLVVGRARLRETLKQSKQTCRGFETFRHLSLRWHLVVIFKYCSETALTKKQLSELTNYYICCVNRSTKWFGGVVSVLDWNAVSLGSNPGWSSHLHKIIIKN